MQERDDIDKLLINSNEMFNVSIDYNEKLLNKIHALDTNSKSINLLEYTNTRVRTVAASLIMGGILIFILSVPSVETNVIKMQTWMKSTISTATTFNGNINIKNILGE